MELLSPAGSPAALEAALRGGADAVYLGAHAFNARMNAVNFDAAGIAEAAAACHRAGARLYVTLNTLVLEREYADALKTARELYNAGVDALIVADLGLTRELRLNFPDFELHASTQAGVHSADGARAMADLGFTRVVAARELTKQNITSICRTGIETEIFIHGALCVCHSGQCLFSSLVGGRSGNRGECAQPCRLAYNGGYPLSLKDNCLAAHIREIEATGAASLKIEGRMKSPDYVYTVTSTWRRLIDDSRDATEREIDAMARVFSREGFTDGYFTGHIGRAMNGVRSEGDKRRTERVKSGKQPRLTNGNEPIAAPERNDITPAVHPVDLRTGADKPYMTARFYDPRSIPKDHPFRAVYLPLEVYDSALADGVLVPPVVTDAERERVLRALTDAVKSGAKRALVGNAGHFALAREAGFEEINADFRLGAYSAQTAQTLCELGARGIIFSPELTLPQLRDIRAQKGAIVYGRVPLMLLEKRLGVRELRDRRGVVFPILREAGRDILVNSSVTYMADKPADLDRAGITDRHFIFTTESAAEVRAVIRAYQTHSPSASKNIRRIK